MTEFFRKIALNPRFNQFIIWVILLAGVIVGIETYGERVVKWHNTLHILDMTILWIFTIEAVIKILAEGDKPLNYFKDPWNVFDFLIVLVCWVAIFTPSLDAGFVAVFRLARVLRVLRLVGAMPQLKTLVDAMLKSIPSMGYVGILLFLLFYIYGAMGVFLFGKNDPVYFGTLGTALVTLFQIVTLEGWADIMYKNVFGCDHAIWGTDHCDNPQAMGYGALIYFISFVLIGTMIVLNLFIGVIMNSMDEVRLEQELEDQSKRRAAGEQSLEDEVAHLHQQLDGMKKQLDFIAFNVRKKE